MRTTLNRLNLLLLTFCTVHLRKQVLAVVARGTNDPLVVLRGIGRLTHEFLWLMEEL